jgi:hypothetical protein
MDVVGHYGPFQDTISFAVELQKGILHEFGNAFIPKITGPVSSVFKLGDPFTKFHHAGVRCRKR